MRAVYILCGALAFGLIACGGDSNGGTNGSSGSTGSTSSTGTSSTSGDSTVIATSLNDPKDLVVGPSDLFFSSQSSGQNVGLVESLPIAGGSATTINGTTRFPTAVAIDANNVYWIDQDDSDAPEIKKASQDGTNPSVLGSISSNNGAGGPDQDTRLVVVNGTLYWGDSIAGVSSMPVTGGAVTVVVAPSDLAGGPLIAADANGLTFTELSSGNDTLIRHAALDGSGATTLATVTFNPTATLQAAAIGSDGSNAYWAIDDISSGSDVSTIYKVANAGGSPTTVLTYDGDIDALAVDGSGVYFHDSVGSTEGIYKVTGSSSTLVHSDPDRLSTSSGNERLLRLDAQNLYWVGGGFNDGQAVLHKMAR